VKEIDLLDANKVNQMKKVIITYAKTNDTTLKILDEYMTNHEGDILADD
jgi:hypothetical protein